VAFGLYYLVAGATPNEVCGFNSTRLTQVQLSRQGEQKRRPECLPQAGQRQEAEDFLFLPWNLKPTKNRDLCST